MLELCRKRTLARRISAMAAQFPAHYQFCPQTYVLPEDLPSLLKDFKSNKKGAPKTLILKPDSGSQVRSTVGMLLTLILLPALWITACQCTESIDTVIIGCFRITKGLSVLFQ